MDKVEKQELTSNFFCEHSESIIKNCHLYFGVLAFDKDGFKFYY